MGGEWSKAVGMIFNQKYSKGRGKLSDAMKDPATRALHEQLKGGKTGGKSKKMRGGEEPEPETGAGDGGDGDGAEGGGKKLTLQSLEARVRALESRQEGGFPATKHSKTKSKSSKKSGGSKKKRATRRR
jgi:hypothetical protein